MRSFSVPDDTWQTAATRQSREALQERVEALCARAQDVDLQRRAFMDASVADSNPSGTAQLLVDAELSLLADELALRSDMTAWLRCRAKDLQAERESATAGLEAMESHIRRQLLDIGYTEGRVGSAQGLDQSFLQRHPLVFAAKERLRCSRQDSTSDLHAANAEAMAELRKELERRKMALRP